MINHNLKEVEAIVAIDYSNVGSKVTPHKLDIECAYLLINSWLNMVDEYDHFSAIDMYYYMSKRGLIPLVTLAKQVSSQLIHGEVEKTHLFFPLICHLGDNERMTLQLLRYPTRFAYPKLDALAEASIQTFLDRNKEVGLLDEGGLHIPTWLQSALHSAGKSFFKNYKKGNKFQVPTGTVAVQPGQNLKKPSSLAEKLRVAKEFNFSILYGHHNDVVTDALRLRYRNRYTRKGNPIKHTDRYGWKLNTYGNLSAVPKNLSEMRLVLVEEPDRQMELGLIADGCTKCILTSTGYYGSKGYLDLQDQVPNQELALYGSIYQNIATIDLTAASDYQTFTFLRCFIPEDIFDDLLEWRSNYLYIRTPKGCVKYKNNMPLTMGSRVTPALQTIGYWLLLNVARKILDRFGVATRKSLYRAYNDDIICPTEAFDTVVDLLTLCGFKVNLNKTFAQGFYRESCGVEYYKGEELSSMYWPRDFELEGTSAIAALVKLQNRLWNISRQAAEFLESYILQRKPTIPQVWSGSSDIGLYRSVPVTEERMVFPPFDKKKMDEIPPSVKPYVERKVTRAMKLESKYRDQPISAEAQELAYYMFLAEGPNYDSPLLELLGVSQPRGIQALNSSPTLKLSSFWKEEEERGEEGKGGGEEN